MIIKSLILSLSLSIFLLKNDCNHDKTIHLNDGHHGKQIKLFRGQKITLSLDANPTTGYTWMIAQIDTNIVKPQHSEFKSASERIGSPGKQIFHFRTLASGQTELRLIYHRPWEKDSSPLNIFHIKLNITN